MELLAFFTIFFLAYFLGAAAAFIWACTDSGQVWTAIARGVWDEFSKRQGWDKK